MQRRTTFLLLPLLLCAMLFTVSCAIAPTSDNPIVRYYETTYGEQYETTTKYDTFLIPYLKSVYQGANVPTPEPLVLYPVGEPDKMFIGSTLNDGTVQDYRLDAEYTRQMTPIFDKRAKELMGDQVTAGFSVGISPYFAIANDEAAKELLSLNIFEHLYGTPQTTLLPLDDVLVSPIVIVPSRVMYAVDNGQQFMRASLQLHQEFCEYNGRNLFEYVTVVVIEDEGLQHAEPFLETKLLPGQSFLGTVNCPGFSHEWGTYEAYTIDDIYVSWSTSNPALFQQLDPTQYFLQNYQPQ